GQRHYVDWRHALLLMTLTQVLNCRASGNDVIENRCRFLIVLSSSQSCTVKAKLRLRLLDEASVISICEKGGECLTRLTKPPRVHPLGMQRYRQ
ncbi:MAG: hypothetical protein VYD68_04605, partial [Pseudomonadota bacterium]|nr:hypothetical protein [Pseudomonadota bacterium]